MNGHCNGSAVCVWGGGVKGGVRNEFLNIFYIIWIKGIKIRERALSRLCQIDNVYKQKQQVCMFGSVKTGNCHLLKNAILFHLINVGSKYFHGHKKFKTLL